MEENTEKQLEDILKEGKVYLETRAEFLRLYVLEKVSKMFADLVTNVFVIICFILAFLFAIITLALFLSDVFNSFTAGFGSVCLILILIAVVVNMTKEKYIEKALINIAIKKYFNKIADKDDEKL
jgi:uncharacterized membrane protein